MQHSPPLPLFGGIGVELEYTIVNASSLHIAPIADQLFHSVSGEYRPSINRGAIEWSNELALHVIELKTNGPAFTLNALPALFHEEVRAINEYLVPFDARLMPTAMHPWMNPSKETKLWPHDYNPVYEAFDRIFGCRGHGWSNLQSMHLNFPFANDAEFGRLHAAIRMVLPILPALAASSPFIEGAATGFLDNRLNVYRTNSARIPSITGDVIPEPVWTRTEYENHILQRIYSDLAPHDPDSVLQEEWVNARGAIARFERNTIEIRILDVQECPAADLAIAAATLAALHDLVDEKSVSLKDQQSIKTQDLQQIFFQTIKDGADTVLDNRPFLAAFNVEVSKLSVGELWSRLVERLLPDALLGSEPWQRSLQLQVRKGPLSRRILNATGPNPSSHQLYEVYLRLCDCLLQGIPFPGDS